MTYYDPHHRPPCQPDPAVFAPSPFLRTRVGTGEEVALGRYTPGNSWVELPDTLQISPLNRPKGPHQLR